jgi:hypothetical protein
MNKLRGTRMLAPSRLVLVLSLTLLSQSSLAACSKSKPEHVAPTVDASELQRRAEDARRSLKALEPAFAPLSAKLRALHEEFDPLPPGLEGFGETRSRFYTLSIAVGAMTAKPAWLSGRIDAAVKAKDLAELSAISKEIDETHAQLRQAEERAAELSQQVQPFKNAALRRMEELQARGKTSCE